MGNMWAMNQEKMSEGFHTPSPLIPLGRRMSGRTNWNRHFWWSPCCRFIHCCCVEFVVVKIFVVGIIVVDFFLSDTVLAEIFVVEWIVVVEIVVDEIFVD